jgi:hypothetical protein
MAITVIGGLTAATLLTLIFIPCMYRIFSRDRAVDRNRSDETRDGGAGIDEPAIAAAAREALS